MSISSVREVIEPSSGDDVDVSYLDGSVDRTFGRLFQNLVYILGAMATPAKRGI